MVYGMDFPSGEVLSEMSCPQRCKADHQREWGDGTLFNGDNGAHFFITSDGVNWPQLNPEET